MTEATPPPGPPESQPATDPTPPDWFHQIPFDPKKGLDSVLPVVLPDGVPLDPPDDHHADHAALDGG